jgi:hypothetical protein
MHNIVKQQKVAVSQPDKSQHIGAGFIQLLHVLLQGA